MLSGIAFVVLGTMTLRHGIRLLRDWREHMSALAPPMPMIERVPILATISMLNLTAIGLMAWGVFEIIQ